MQPSSSWISTLLEAGMDYSLLRRQLWILVPISGSGKLRPFNSRISMLPKRWHAVLGKIFSLLLRLLLRIQRGRCFDKGSSMKTNLRTILWKDDLLPRTLLMCCNIGRWQSRHIQTSASWRGDTWLCVQAQLQASVPFLKLGCLSHICEIG